MGGRLEGHAVRRWRQLDRPALGPLDPGARAIRVRRLTIRISSCWTSSATIVVIVRPWRTSRTVSAAGPTRPVRRKLVDIVRIARPGTIDSAARTANAHM